MYSYVFLHGVYQFEYASVQCTLMSYHVHLAMEEPGHVDSNQAARVHQQDTDTAPEDCLGAVEDSIAGLRKMMVELMGRTGGGGWPAPSLETGRQAVTVGK